MKNLNLWKCVTDGAVADELRVGNLTPKRIGYEKLGVHLYRVWDSTRPIGTVHAVGGLGWRAMNMTGGDCGVFETRAKAAEGLRKVE